MIEPSSVDKVNASASRLKFLTWQLQYAKQFKADIEKFHWHDDSENVLNEVDADIEQTRLRQEREYSRLVQLARNAIDCECGCGADQATQLRLTHGQVACFREDIGALPTPRGVALFAIWTQ